jgi:EAL domain-containing protein (putative c-di-GMP-specific phosphodiesterase class I)
MGAFTLLRRLQVDFLKIAGSVVQSITRGPVDRVLAGALVEIGRALGLGTIGAEAENPETLACLRGLGVDCAQGYGVGRPEPLDTALGRLVAP